MAVSDTDKEFAQELANNYGQGFALFAGNNGKIHTIGLSIFKNAGTTPPDDAVIIMPEEGSTPINVPTFKLPNFGARK